MSSDTTQIAPQGHFATVNGMQMYYEEYGEGPVLLLLHGFCDSSQGWQSYLGIEQFAKYFRVIVPDLRGHGRSLDPKNQFTFAQTALDVFALLDQLGVEPIRALGGSGGGLTLEYLASQQPSRLEAIILSNCGYYFSEKTRTHLLNWAQSDDTDWATLGQKHLQGASQAQALASQLPNIMDSYDSEPPDLAKITAKTLIIFGDRDEMMTVSMPVEMYAQIPNSYLWIVPNAGHDVIADDPERRALYVRTALAFLQGEW